MLIKGMSYNCHFNYYIFRNIHTFIANLKKLRNQNLVLLSSTRSSINAFICFDFGSEPAPNPLF